MHGVNIKIFKYSRLKIHFWTVTTYKVVNEWDQNIKIGLPNEFKECEPN